MGSRAQVGSRALVGRRAQVGSWTAVGRRFRLALALRVCLRRGKVWWADLGKTLLRRYRALARRHERTSSTVELLQERLTNRGIRQLIGNAIRTCPPPTHQSQTKPCITRQPRTQHRIDLKSKCSKGTGARGL